MNKYNKYNKNNNHQHQLNKFKSHYWKSNRNLLFNKKQNHSHKYKYLLLKSIHLLLILIVFSLMLHGLQIKYHKTNQHLIYSNHNQYKISIKLLSFHNNNNLSSHFKMIHKYNKMFIPIKPSSHSKFKHHLIHLLQINLIRMFSIKVIHNNLNQYINHSNKINQK